MKNAYRRNSMLAGALALAFTLTTGLMLAGPSPKPGSAAPRISPPNSSAYGKTLTEWMGIYLRWLITGSDPDQSKVDGVQLLPLPPSEWAGGSGTPDDPVILIGQVAITLPAGTPFVLAEIAWTCERYMGYPAVADDPPMSDETFLGGIHPTLTIDGRTVLTEDNKAAFHVPTTAFDPMIAYPEPTWYGSVATVAFQTVGTVSPPLSVGQHVITLHAPFIVSPEDYQCLNYPDGFGVVYEQTWLITVAPR